MLEEIRAVKRFFESKGILISQEWLESCVNWFKQENGDNYTLDELQSQVYEQWLLFDFRDVHLPVLPTNIKSEKKIILNKVMFLQLMSIIDISKPKLTQINNIRNKIALSNTAEENMVSGKRVLQLTLTDGVQEILATEYKTIHFLNLNLTPGLKVRINPPIIVRRGQIMLEQANIKILGGDVADLIVSNAAENMLAKALGLPLAENPIAMQEMDLVNQTQNTQPNQIYDNNTHRTPQIPNERNTNTRDNYSVQTTLPIYSNSSRSGQEERTSTLLMFEDDDFDPDCLNKIDHIVSKVKSQETKTTPSTVINTATRNYIEDFNNEDYEMLMEMDKPPPNPSPKLVQKPILAIDKILKMKNNVNKGKFTINAKFKNIVKKLSISNEKYLLQICIEDSSGEMNVDLDSDVISSLIGYNPEAFRKLSSTKESSTIQRIFAEFKDKLISLNSKMDVLIESGQNVPTVVKLI